MTLKSVESEAGAVPRLLSLREVAGCLGVCVRTVRRLIDKGELARVYVGSSVRVRQCVLAVYLANLREAFPQGPPLGAPARERVAHLLAVQAGAGRRASRSEKPALTSEGKQRKEET